MENQQCSMGFSTHILSHYGKVVIVCLLFPSTFDSILVPFSCSLNACFFVPVLWVVFQLQPRCCRPGNTRKTMESDCLVWYIPYASMSQLLLLISPNRNLRQKRYPRKKHDSLHSHWSCYCPPFVDLEQQFLTNFWCAILGETLNLYILLMVKAWLLIGHTLVVSIKLFSPDSCWYSRHLLVCNALNCWFCDSKCVPCQNPHVCFS